MTPPFFRPVVHRKARLPGADTLVAEALTFVADDPERIGHFLSASGLSAADLRYAAAQPAFLESLLDHLCQDEPLLLAFAQEHGYDPADIERLRQSLAPPFFEG